MEKFCLKDTVISNTELLDIFKITEKKEFVKGERICREGEILDKLIIILEGKVKASKVTKEGKEQIIHILTSGDFIGEENLFYNKVSGFTATAINTVKISILSREDLESVLKNNPEIAIDIIKELTYKLSEAEDLAKILATRDVEARIAKMLLEFINKYGKKSESGIIINLPINREDMASYCGVTRETISRKLSKLEGENIIEVKGNKVIIVTNLEKLIGLSE